MNGINLSNIRGLFCDNYEYTKMYYGSTLIWNKLYEQLYLTIVVKGAGNIKVTIDQNTSTTQLTSISYSKDNGHTWTTTNNVDDQQITITVPVNNNDRVMWKGIGKTMYGVKFYANINHDIEGNIMSLLNGDNFYNSTFDTNYNQQFLQLFSYDRFLVDATNLILPATTLTIGCYAYMFEGCTRLTTAPALPATTLASDCYNQMFSGCTRLTTAPALPATTLVTECYIGMFDGCTSLITAPELPATTLTVGCYSGMFSGCTNLTSAPTLAATTLADYCYSGMFYRCTGLTIAPALPATTLAQNCYDGMFEGCTGLTTAPALPATTLARNCYNQMFEGCTGLTTAPALPATTLDIACYFGMFRGCTSLTTSPALPATTLGNLCYYQMFEGCTSLEYIKMLATDISASDCLTNWVDGVANSGTFIKNASMTTLPTGTSGIPSGWTVIDN